MMNSSAAARVLLVDDEPSIHEPLREYLVGNGFHVEVAETAADARAQLAARKPDLMLLDVMMPGEDGFSLTRDLRARSDIPIILLTAKAEDTDRIIGLEMGADDYIVKPFNPRELLARMKAVLRRMSAPKTNHDEKFAFADFVLDPGARTLTRAMDEAIELTGGEFSLLHALVERAGRVLNRDQLLDLTQGRAAGVFDRSIDNQISRLRKKIEPDAKAPTIIKTVRGGGYVLAAKVTRQ